MNPAGRAGSGVPAGCVVGGVEVGWLGVAGWVVGPSSVGPFVGATVGVADMGIGPLEDGGGAKASGSDVVSGGGLVGAGTAPACCCWASRSCCVGCWANGNVPGLVGLVALGAGLVIGCVELVPLGLLSELSVGCEAESRKLLRSTHL